MIHLDQLSQQRALVNDQLQKTREKAERFSSGSEERELEFIRARLIFTPNRVS